MKMSFGLGSPEHICTSHIDAKWHTDVCNHRQSVRQIYTDKSIQYKQLLDCYWIAGVLTKSNVGRNASRAYRLVCKELGVHKRAMTAGITSIRSDYTQEIPVLD